MIKVKIDLLAALKEKGVTSYTCKENGLIGQRTLTQIKRGMVPGLKTIDTICEILKCQPGDLLEWVPDEKEE